MSKKEGPLDIIKNVASEIRVKILRALRDYGPINISDISKLANVRARTLSYHLSELEKRKLINSSSSGDTVEYWITPEGHQALNLIEKFLSQNISIRIRQTGRLLNFDPDWLTEYFKMHGFSQKDIKRLIARMEQIFRDTENSIISDSMLRLLMGHVMLDMKGVEYVDSLFAGVFTMTDVEKFMHLPSQKIYSEIGRMVVGRYISKKIVSERLIKLNDENLIRIVKLGSVGLMFSRFIHNPFSFAGSDPLFELIRGVFGVRDVVRGDHFIPHFNYYLAPFLDKLGMDGILTFFKIFFYSDPTLVVGIGLDLDIPPTIEKMTTNRGGIYGDYFEEATKIANEILKLISRNGTVFRNYVVLNIGTRLPEQQYEDTVLKCIKSAALYFTNSQDRIELPALSVPDGNVTGIPIEIVLNLSEIAQRSANETIFFEELSEIIFAITSYLESQVILEKSKEPIRKIYGDQFMIRPAIGYIGLPECVAKITRCELGNSHDVTTFAINVLYFIQKNMANHGHQLYQYNLDHFLGEIVPADSPAINSANISYRIPLGIISRLKTALALNKYIRETIQLPYTEITMRFVEDVVNSGIKMVNFYDLLENDQPFCIERGYVPVDSLHQKLYQLELEGRRNILPEE